jgi:hypothetical protein
MNNIFLGHKTDRKKFLLCDEIMNPIQEVFELPLNSKQMAKAFYVNFPNGYMGAFATTKGPCFFINRDKYDFTDSSWCVHVEKFINHNHVSFKGLQSGDLAFDYSRIKINSADMWGEENLDDFYIWLEQARAKKELIEMWTL